MYTYLVLNFICIDLIWFVNCMFWQLLHVQQSSSFVSCFILVRNIFEQDRIIQNKGVSISILHVPVHSLGRFRHVSYKCGFLVYKTFVYDSDNYLFISIE